MQHFAIIQNGFAVVVVSKKDGPPSSSLGEAVELAFADFSVLGKQYIGGIWVDKPTPVTWLISKRAFKDRFPRAKWNAASMASNSNPLLYDFFETYREVPFINLKDEETQYVLMALSMETIPAEMRLTGEEVDAVLNVEAQPHELP